jgi:uncharacterized protein (DUF2384 family)
MVLSETTRRTAVAPDPEWSQFREDVERAQGTLASAEVVPKDVRMLVFRLAERLEEMPGSAWQEVDPYFVVALQGGTIQALRAFDVGSTGQERRGVRMGLERVRQALRDVADEGSVADERPAKMVVRWLVDTLDASYPRIAELLHTSPRTLQRWLSEEPTEPRGEDAARVRLVARITNQLRHVLTGEGVLCWFDSPRDELGQRRPRELLSDLNEATQLIKLAASARVSVGT